MNHESIAIEALRYRLRSSSASEPERFDVERAAAHAVAIGDPEIDSALRQIGAEWVRVGLRLEHITEPWEGPEVEVALAHVPRLVDALDTIVRRVTQRVLCT